MTDDDTDDRMERADRIRQMREGRRRGTDGSDDSNEDGAGDDRDDDSSESAEVESADTESADEATGDTAGGDDTADGASTDDGGADSTATDGASSDERPNERESERDTGDETDEGSAGDSADADEETVVLEDDEPTDPAASAAQPGESDEVAEPAAGEQKATAAETDQGGADAADVSVEESGFEFEAAPGGDEAGETDDGQSARREAAAVLAEAGIADSVAEPDEVTAADRLRRGERFAIPDQATTVTESEAGTTAEGTGSVAAARAAVAGETAYTGERTRVLEFTLGEERFCLDIEYVEEIVELENVTRVPNSPSHVEGVVDLRGQVTAIINPKDTLDVENDGRGDLVVVFDSEEFEEQGHVGWVVDDVRQVTPVSEEEVNESPEDDAEYINGIINRDDEDGFVVWTSPDVALNS